MIDHLSCLRQQLLVLTDVVQALLEIIDERRPSQKARRAVRKLREKVKRYWHKAEQSVVYKILAFVSAVATVMLIIKLVIWFFHSIKK